MPALPVASKTAILWAMTETQAARTALPVAASAGGPRSALRRLAPVGARFARDLAYLTIGLATAVVGFAVWVTGVSVVASLAVLIVGIPASIVAFWAFRLIADLDRRNAALVLGAPIKAGYRSRDRAIGRQAAGSRPGEDRDRVLRALNAWLARLAAVLKDPQSWKDLAWLVLHSVIGFAFGITVLTLLAYTLGIAVLPVWWWSIPDDVNLLGIWHPDGALEIAITVPLALPLAALTIALARAMALGESALARALLGRSEAELERRVERLEETRAGAVSAAAEQLERIERDLHDGAQARLVSLAVDLGLAQERFDEDPEGARALVAEAGEEAKRTLAELRDLARGMRPALLAERGLEEAVRALAGRSPIAVSLDSGLEGETLPPNVESAAYFVVAEGLTNVAKHSRADRAEVRLARSDHSLVVEIRDDGIGGADPKGAGLDGLRRRVEALDGRLRVLTGEGEGTSIRAELPCAS